MSYNLSRNIKVLLTIHNKEREEFGKLIGNSSKSTVTSWTKGIATPPLDKLIMICKEFDLSLDELVFGEVGKNNPAYDDFVRKNHPDLLNEQSETYFLKDGDVVLNDHIFKEPDKMGALVRWLTNHHQELSKDALYDLYRRRVVQEHENNMRRKNIRERLLTKKESK
jgi:transcriptional regulator with XRE-family HTH domain